MLTRRSVTNGLVALGATAALPLNAPIARPDHRVVAAALAGPRECWAALIAAAEEFPPLWDLVEEVCWWVYDGEAPDAMEAELRADRSARAQRVNAPWRARGGTSYADRLRGIAAEFAQKH
jgi:hypothetical protein